MSIQPARQRELVVNLPRRSPSRHLFCFVCRLAPAPGNRGVHSTRARAPADVPQAGSGDETAKQRDTIEAPKGAQRRPNLAAPPPHDRVLLDRGQIWRPASAAGSPACLVSVASAARPPNKWLSVAAVFDTVHNCCEGIERVAGSGRGRDGVVWLRPQQKFRLDRAGKVEPNNAALSACAVPPKTTGSWTAKRCSFFSCVLHLLGYLLFPPFLRRRTLPSPP